LSHCCTGIEGLDRILGGGLPVGRPTLLRGGPGTGKTVTALSFLCHRVAVGEAGVLVSFDESPEALLGYAEAFGFPARAYRDDGRLQVLDMRPDRGESMAGGAVELSAVLARIELALQRQGATNLVLDAFETLDSAFGEISGGRGEVARVLDWVRERRVTALLTTGDYPHLEARYGIADYVADCVVLLRQEVQNRVMTRVLRVIKRRGGGHGTNDYPFLLDDDGLFVLPVTSSALDAMVSTERISTGIARLDAMLGGEGVYRGSTVMFSGQAGTGKTSLASTLALAACERGETVLYVSFEESVQELIRNQRCLGVDLGAHHGEGGRLHLQPVRAVEIGLEAHLMRVMRAVERLRPELVVLDPISGLSGHNSGSGTKEMLVRLFHLLKERGVTAVATELLADDSTGVSRLDVSSFIDVWIKLRRQESDGELNRLVQVVKGRGLPISNQLKEFHIGAGGIAIESPYLGPGGIAYGAAKAEREAQDRDTVAGLQREHTRLAGMREVLAQVSEANARMAESKHQEQMDELARKIADIERELERIQRYRAAMEEKRR
jgi:circadian clock protein KaiC